MLGSQAETPVSKETGVFLIMRCTVYILQSQSTGRFYCGQTDHLERRLYQHNDPNYHGSRTTKVFPGPWILV
ncbi:MAG: hypothetical protein DSY89_01780 [Deltaproteobacteria bacterium]|nr:MAG: hypothetical protein DSY89_01780 [Deltaproteobacteria bacterium]